MLFSHSEGVDNFLKTLGSSRKAHFEVKPKFCATIAVSIDVLANSHEIRSIHVVQK